MGEDPAGTLEQLAGIGYKYVEGASYDEGMFYGQKPEEFKKMLKSAGLKMPSGHTLTGRMNPEKKKTMTGGNWEGAVEDFKKLDQEYIVLAWLPENEREGLDDYKELVDILNKAGETCKEYGIQLAYHNHDFEFIEMEGTTPYELLLSQCDPELIKMELDIYWTVKAGKDPVQFFEKMPGRFPLLHIKDMDDTPKQFFTEVGNGVIDWKKVFSGAHKSGLDYFFVEQDVSKAPMESVKKSIAYLKELRF